MNIDRRLLKNYDTAEPAVRGAPPLPDNRRPIAVPVSSRFASSTEVITPPPSAIPAPPRLKTPPLVTHPAAPVTAPTTDSKPAGDTNISINITMPKLPRPVLPAWPYKKIVIWAGLALLVFIASLVAHGLITAAIERHKEYQAKHQINMIDQRQSPSFTPLVPKATPAVVKTTAYDPKRDSYSYSDTLKGLAVIVSQQPMPAGANSDALAKIAKSINATTPLITGQGTAYLASSAAGAQTVVMDRGSLLIFVQSAFSHSNDDWISYLDTLQS